MCHFQSYAATCCLAALLSATVGCRQETGEISGKTELQPAGGLTKVTLVLNWYPEAEHGGYYAALVHGYYKEAGLDVTIVPGGPGSPVIAKVDGKTAHFGVTNADRVLLGRAQEADVVTVMAPIQTSPRCILVHRESGIDSIRDLKDVTLAMKASATWAKFMQKKLSLTGVKIVPNAGAMAFFIDNPKYAIQGYTFSEPFVAREKGAETKELLVSEIGFNPYTSVLVTHSSQVKQDPKIVRKMVAASIRGWKKYLDDPGQTNAHIHKLNTGMSLPALAFGVQAMKPLCITKQVRVDQLGTMNAQRWQTLASQMVEVGSLDAGKSDPSGAFTLKFVGTDATLQQE